VVGGGRAGVIEGLGAELDDARPRSRLTPRVRRDVLIDRTAYRFVTTVAARVDPAVLERVRGEVAEAVGLFEERGWIDDPASYHREPPMPSEVRERRRTSGRIRFTTLTWADGYEVRAEEPGAARYTGYDRNRIARAALLEHRSGARPWVLCVHGFGMGTHALDLRAFRALHLHRDLGLNVAFVTLPLHGRRKPPGVRLGAMPGVDLLDTVHGMAQAVWDVRQLMAVLRERGPEPIALLGMSLGSCVSAIVASLDEVDAALLMAPAVDLGTLMIEAGGQGGDAELASIPAENLDQAMRILAPVAPLQLTPRISADRAFIAAATLDRFARPRSQAMALWRHWGEPELHWSHGGHVSHLWSPTAQRAVDAALTRMGFVVPVASDGGSGR
jgi:pimeloyl-ACP methyl ester carboxylesterase